MKKIPCRVCLTTGSPRIDMLSNPLPKYPGADVSLLEMFALVTEIAMQVGENSILCSNCQKRLTDAYNFRCEAQRSNVLLETIILPQKEEYSVAVKEEGADYEDYEALENVETHIKDESFAAPPAPPPLTKKETPVVVRRRRNRASSIPLPPATLTRFHCRYCFGHFPNSLKKHEAEHIVANGGLECHHCGKKFRIRNLIREHLRMVHFTDKSDPNRVRWTCDLCGRSYSEKASLRNHKRDKHSDNPKIHQKVLCPLCGKAVRCVSVHIYHMHEQHDLLTCDLCQKQFKTKMTLKAHFQARHMEKKPPEIPCPECSKMFGTESQVKDHLQRVHYTVGQKFQCEICSTKFKSMQSYKFHMKMHQASLDHRCEVCGNGFKTRAYLLQHMKAHSEEKNYTCDVCHKSFKRSGQLVKHKWTHEDRRFYCEYCPNESFIDATTLRMHNEKVHLGIRYKCECGKEYGMKKHLRQHQTAQNHDKNKWSKVIPIGVELESNSGYWSSSNQ
ncbi:zinc finger protein draculin-like [Culicoides brevitarsis]|uniref:zinc finger protein draculin-like n=1 Tax=Culicoides brevitarsis TaxID=469753 RepID=UPI00307B8E2B